MLRMHEDKQEWLDWLDGTIDELLDDVRRLQGLRRKVDESGELRRSELDDIETVAHNLELDVMRFKRRVPQ